MCWKWSVRCRMAFQWCVHLIYRRLNTHNSVADKLHWYHGTLTVRKLSAAYVFKLVGELPHSISIVRTYDFSPAQHISLLGRQFAPVPWYIDFTQTECGVCA